MHQSNARRNAIICARNLLIILALFSVNAAQAQQGTPSPEADDLKQLQIPSVAPDYRGQHKPLPELRRVGVDMDRQHPLSMREALSMALENNKDIEVARQNVKIAEFDLLGAHGLYDPKISTTAFYERIKTPLGTGKTFAPRNLHKR